MKKLFLSAILLTFLSAPAWANGANDVQVKVNGMVCDFCAQSVMKLFGREDAVAQTHVDLGGGFIALDFKSGMDIDDERIAKLITDSGYDVVEIIRK